MISLAERAEMATWVHPSPAHNCESRLSEAHGELLFPEEASRGTLYHEIKMEAHRSVNEFLDPRRHRGG